MRAEPLLIEGYASLFGRVDSGGDSVRAGAFARSLRRAGSVAMLIQHRDGASAGRWTRIGEDGRGLFVRGLVEAPGALALVAQGLSGLSIGFRPTRWSIRPGGGRELIEVDLVEISLVRAPMLSAARFSVQGRSLQQAA